jgi:SPP1 gp7 family putative phage head morphogenesis protein
LISNIQDVFHGSGLNHPKRIARTETTRMLSESKLLGYKESGIEGHKAWDAVGDSHTSPLCLRLHRKYFEKGIPFDDEFTDEETGWHGQGAPSHVNCRSTLQFRSKV